jgi:hypothetical protein
MDAARLQWCCCAAQTNNEFTQAAGQPHTSAILAGPDVPGREHEHIAPALGGLDSVQAAHQCCQQLVHVVRAPALCRGSSRGVVDGMKMWKKEMLIPLLFPLPNGRVAMWQKSLPIMQVQSGVL